MCIKKLFMTSTPVLTCVIYHHYGHILEGICLCNLAEYLLLASQEGFCSIELISQ
jgi:hypothetical protein